MWPRLAWWVLGLAAWPAAKWAYEQFKEYFEMSEIDKEVAARREEQAKDIENAIKEFKRIHSNTKFISRRNDE